DSRQTVRGLLPTQKDMLVAFRQPTNSFYSLNEQKAIVAHQRVPSYGELDASIRRTGVRFEYPTALAPFSEHMLTGGGAAGSTFYMSTTGKFLEKAYVDARNSVHTVHTLETS